MSDEQQEGIVFNIQKFSVNDGDGIRDLVFLKGCPLRCRWCSNPESQHPWPEHAFNPSRCLTADVCGRCLKACHTGALSLMEGLICFDARRCRNCFACANVCPSNAETVYGTRMTVAEVLEKVERDSMFYVYSGGGMTLSGGECLFQADFSLALLREAWHRGIDTAIETCGYYKYEVLREACHYLNRLIMDIKCVDPRLHKIGTGVDNALILENFRRVNEEFPDLPKTFRTPVIPGFNDNEEEIAAIRAIIPRQDNVTYELLPYHPMGQPKYGYLARDYALAGAKLDKELMRHLKEVAL